MLHLKINVVIPAEHCLKLSVAENTKVKQLKDVIFQLQGMPPDSQCLVCNGEILTDDNSLSNYAIENGTITLIKCEKQEPIEDPEAKQPIDPLSSSPEEAPSDNEMLSDMDSTDSLVEATSANQPQQREIETIVLDSDSEAETVILGPAERLSPIELGDEFDDICTPKFSTCDTNTESEEENH